MLVLSRRIGETLHIGDDVVIEIKRVAGRRVTIAIEAPRDLRILRGEIMEAATAFDEPADPSNRVPALSSAARTPATRLDGAHFCEPVCEPVAEVIQIEPYLVSHPR